MSAAVFRSWLRSLMGLAAATFSSCSAPDAGGSSAAAATERVDLTQRPWFPPVVAQQGFSCSQQAGLYYAFAAEWNLRSGGAAPLRFSPYFAYSMLAGENSGRSHVVDGWLSAQHTGVPLFADSPRYTRALMHGYDRYRRALQHRVDRWEVLPLGSAADVSRAQRLLADGHPLVCDFQIKGTALRPLPASASRPPASPALYIHAWGRTGPGHAMVYAGYDAALGIDANADGLITTDTDITGDGKVTLADCERGAFLLINPWGSAWGDRGRVWVPARLHAAAAWPWSRSVARVIPAPAAHPRLMLRLSLRAADRQNVLVRVSDGRRTVQPWMFSHDPAPAAGASVWEAFAGLRAPGPHLTRGALAGPGGGPLETGHDVSELNSSGPFSIEIRPAGRGALRGTLHAAALLHYDAGGRLLAETPLPGLPAPLPSDGGSWDAQP